ANGMVVPLSGTRIRSFLACSTDFRIASGTSRALPRPTPTWPRPSPTTTSAVKENRRPPLTTLATRLMATTRSVRSSALASIFASATHVSLFGTRLVTLMPTAVRQCLGSQVNYLERQAAGAGRLGQSLDTTMVLIAPAVEHDLADAALLGLLRDELAHDLRRRDVAPGF